jgi:hypothetical protein
MRQILLTLPFVVACGSAGNSADWDTPGLVSPAGWAKARVSDLSFDERRPWSQVSISFDGGQCGTGSFAFALPPDEIQLRWSDAESLVVTYPAGVVPSPPAGASRTVARHQCLNRVVEVLLEVRRPPDA